MNRNELIKKIETNKQLLSNLHRKRNNIEKQISDLERKIANQENTLMNMKEDKNLA